MLKHSLGIVIKTFIWIRLAILCLFWNIKFMNDFSCEWYLVSDSGLNVHKIEISENPIHNSFWSIIHLINIIYKYFAREMLLAPLSWISLAILNAYFATESISIDLLSGYARQQQWEYESEMDRMCKSMRKQRSHQETRTLTWTLIHSSIFINFLRIIFAVRWLQQTHYPVQPLNC